MDNIYSVHVKKGKAVEKKKINKKNRWDKQKIKSNMMANLNPNVLIIILNINKPYASI